MPNCKLTAKSLSEWFATPQGGYVLTREQAYFDRTVSDIFGYNALQLGLPEHDFLRSSRMPLRFSAGNQQGNAVRLCCTELPFVSASLDLVLIPHVLEFAEQPHQILREVERVLMPEGSLIISGFNPRSLWGLRKTLGGVHRALGGKQGYPWRGHFIALPRLKDWLAVLGFGGVGFFFLTEITRAPGGRRKKPQGNERLVSKLLPVAPKLNNKITQRRGTARRAPTKTFE